MRDPTESKMSQRIFFFFMFAGVGLLAARHPGKELSVLSCGDHRATFENNHVCEIHFSAVVCCPFKQKAILRHFDSWIKTCRCVQVCTLAAHVLVQAAPIAFIVTDKSLTSHNILQNCILGIFKYLCYMFSPVRHV